MWPVQWQSEGDAAGSSGDPGGHGDQVPAQGASTGPGMKQASQATSGAGEVMGDSCQRQPCRLRGERS
jgi:hypothetical protein